MFRKWLILNNSFHFKREVLEQKRGEIMHFISKPFHPLESTVVVVFYFENTNKCVLDQKTTSMKTKYKSVYSPKRALLQNFIKRAMFQLHC